MFTIKQDMEKLYQGLLKFSLEEFELFVELLDLEYPSESERVVFLANFISFIPTQSLYAKHIEILLNRYPSLALPLHVEFCNFLMLSKPIAGNDLTYSHAILSNQTIEFKYFFGQVFNCLYKQDLTTLKSLVSAEQPEHLVQIGAYEFISFFSGYFNDKTVLEAFEDNANLSFFREGLALGGHSSFVNQDVTFHSKKDIETKMFRKDLFDWQNFARGEQKPENKSVAVKIADLLRKFGASNSNEIDLFGVDRIYFEAGFALATLIKTESEIYDLKSTGLVHAVSESLISEFLLGIGFGFKDKDESLLKCFRKAFEQTILDVFISEIKSKGITSDAEDLFNVFELVDFKQIHEFYIESLTQQDPRYFDAQVHGDHIIQIYSKNPACLLNFVSEIVNIDQDFSKNLVQEIKNDIEELQIEASNLMDADGDYLAKKFEEIKELEKLSQKLESKLKRKNLGKRSHQDVVAETSQPVTISFQIGEEQTTEICVDTCKPQAKRPKLFEDDMEEVYQDVMRSNPFDCQMLYDTGGLKYYLLNPNPQIHEEVLDFCGKNLSAANIEEIGSLISIDLLKYSNNKKLSIELLSLLAFVIFKDEELGTINPDSVLKLKQFVFNDSNKSNHLLFLILLVINPNTLPLNFECKDDIAIYLEFLLNLTNTDYASLIKNTDIKENNLVLPFIANLLDILVIGSFSNFKLTSKFFIDLIKNYEGNISDVFFHHQKSEASDGVPEDFMITLQYLHKLRVFNSLQLEDLRVSFEKMKQIYSCRYSEFKPEWDCIDTIINDMIDIEKDPSKADQIPSREVNKSNSIQSDIQSPKQTLATNSLALVGRIIESIYDFYPPEVAWQLIEVKNKNETALKNLELKVEYFGFEPKKMDYANSLKLAIGNLDSFVKDDANLKELTDMLFFIVKVLER